MPFNILGTCPLLGQALQNSWDKPALGTCPSKFLGQARSCDRLFKFLGTGPLLGHALEHTWDRLFLEAGPSTCLGHACVWDRPFQILGTGPLLGQALKMLGVSQLLRHAKWCAKFAKWCTKCAKWCAKCGGTGPSKCLGQARFWDRSF